MLAGRGKRWTPLSHFPSGEFLRHVPRFNKGWRFSRLSLDQFDKIWNFQVISAFVLRGHLLGECLP
jgi:hypothetical protein